MTLGRFSRYNATWRPFKTPLDTLNKTAATEKSGEAINNIKGARYEKDLSAQKENQKQGTRLQKENGVYGRKKGSEEKKKQGQKKAHGVS